MVTGKTGEAAVSVEKGLYLVSPETKETEDALYTVAPMLAMLPRQDESGQWEDTFALDFSEKVSIEERKETYSVEKIWIDDDRENRPESIEVVLLQDHSHVYDTVVLSTENNWRHTWNHLPKGHHWAAFEKDVPEGYKVSYDDRSAGMYIKNVRETTEVNPPVPKPPKEELPNTGQLWWPVPILAVLGLVFFSAGWIRYNHGDRRSC